MTMSQKLSRKSIRLTGRTLKGLSLMEALLALGIGGIVITQSIIGLSSYTTGLQVQATASKVAILNRAADRYAEDNFGTLVAAAPQELPIDVLAPYAGESIGPDAFRNTYKLTTRTYPITVEDPVNGGTKTEQGLQVLVVGEFDPAESPMADELTLRTDIANAAGSSAGFISQDGLTCSDGSGGVRPDGFICGAFGAFSIDPAAFSATNFSNSAVVSLVTKGDSSVYGDQLYRYDYGDPELNTMRTDLFMDDNSILNPNEITDVNRLSLNNGDGVEAVIETEDPSRDLRIRSQGRLALESGVDTLTLNAASNSVTITANPRAPQTDCGTTGCTNAFANLRASNGQMRLDNISTVFGDRSAPYDHGGVVGRTGTGNIWANVANLEKVSAREINSLIPSSTDALRLQRDRAFGEAIIGRRARYRPDGSSAVYEVSDGQLRAQHAQVQDITCADCGGSLSAILPKWRHMGTYFIPQGGSGPNPTQYAVPKPNCGNNRTSVTNRGAIGSNGAYFESGGDNRYQARIILIPRQLGFAGTDANAPVDFRFLANDIGTYWLAYSRSERGNASALAQTYCVFVGGDPNPTSARPQMPSATNPGANPNFVLLE